MLKKVFEIFEKIEKYSETTKENWGFLSMTGKYESQDLTVFNHLSDEFQKLKLNESLIFRLNGEKTIPKNLINDILAGDDWEIYINKSLVLNNLKDDSSFITFFFLKDEFSSWSWESDPLSVEHPFNKYPGIKVVVKGLANPLKGPKIIVCGEEQITTTFDESEYCIPNQKEILDLLHVISDKKLLVIPENHLITFGVIDEFSKGLIKNSIISLLACIVNEIHDNNKVIIRGVRRLELDFIVSEAVEYKTEFNEQLIKIVQWVYKEKEKRELRLKLLLERISLDITLTLPFITGIQPVLRDSFDQAKERYSFIVYERKDLYQKELAGLLKDIKNISDLYSNKVRTLLSNLLRDVLAAFLLLGITIFSKSVEINLLFENNLVIYIFKLFSIYFLFSAIFQLIVDFYDIARTEKEFSYWKEISKEYMTGSEFKKHKSEILDQRARGTKIIYSSIILCYIIISFVCWNFPCIWQSLINNL